MSAAAQASRVCSDNGRRRPRAHSAHTHRRELHAAAFRPNHPSINIGIATVGEVDDDVIDTHLAQDGNAVPLALAMVSRAVTHGLKVRRRERVVCQLGLLNTHHIGLHSFEPFLDPRHPRIERVHVPAGNSHDWGGYRIWIELGSRLRATRRLRR